MWFDFVSIWGINLKRIVILLLRYLLEGLDAGTLFSSILFLSILKIDTALIATSFWHLPCWPEYPIIGAETLKSARL